jgi:membrane-bound lytic murein transglycosylase D
MTKLKRALVLGCLSSIIAVPAYAQYRPIGAGQGSAENTPVEQQNEWLPEVQTPQSEVIEPDPNNIVIQQPLVTPEPPEPAAQTSPPAEVVEVRDLWERIRQGLKLSELNNPRVASHEAAFASEPVYLARIVDRSRRYLHHIVEEVEKRGMPMEIALLPIVESAFNPKAYSRARASGIWQFMPSTGKNYGLQQNWWHDERRDVHAATNAALDYLQMLYRRFNNWELALASYNSGEGRVGRAITYNRVRGLPTDFSSIQLPTETRNYVPKLIAVRNIVRDPARFGLTLAYIPDKPYFVAVSTAKHIDLKRAAEFAEIPVDEFLALNPAFNRPVIAAKESRSILVPAETADIFLAKLENPDQPLVSWRTQKLSRGESLHKVADRFGISASELKEVNGIPSSKKIAGGGMVLVPVAMSSQQPAQIDDGATPEASVAAPYSAPPSISHTVKRGETLSKIARHYRVSTKALQAWNGLRKGRVVVGQRLTIRKGGTAQLVDAELKPRLSKPAKSPNGDTITYRVQRGDTLYSIARRFDVDMVALKRWNNISGKRGLVSGTRVAIPARLKS